MNILSLFFPMHQAIDLCVHPLYLMIPATVSASYAFMVPVATPPNAIAFSYGYLKVYDMVSKILHESELYNVVYIPQCPIGKCPHPDQCPGACFDDMNGKSPLQDKHPISAMYGKCPSKSACQRMFPSMDTFQQTLITPLALSSYSIIIAIQALGCNHRYIIIELTHSTTRIY